ncbi:MAG: aldehyde dehydrogenase family protein, partial [Candidatus Omnitrophica bacterium]|nr:aldehyde dehydrogenase family protein [Candidatus Omnitrophota bacterium]
MTTANAVDTSRVDEIMENAAQAAAVFTQYDQAATDRVVRAVYEAAFANRVKLAKMAYEETKLGNWKDKVIKNVVATQFIYEDMRHLKTVGIIAEDDERGITEIAQPIGPIFALIPTTNPTSTVMFKILIALKTRNPIIIGPHPRAMKCSSETARICYEAAMSADAPENCVQWIIGASMDETHALMSHKKLSLVLATGGSSLVGAAYSSGTPALGVGPGNVPVFIERTADPAFAVDQIMASKTFDNGTICASEQAVVVERPLAAKVLELFRNHKAYVLSEAEVKQLENVAYDRNRGLMNAAVVGQTAPVIAKLAGIQCPPDTVLFIAPQKGVGKDYPLSSEILAPKLAF